MTLLAVIVIAGLALSVLPWKPVACAVAVGLIGWAGYVMFGPANPLMPLTLLIAPALLLGWATGLLIRRTLAERRAA